MKIDITKAASFVKADAIEALKPQVKAAQEALEQGTCAGNDFLGWMHLPSSITPEFIAELNATAKVLQDNCEAVVVAGIGGSYLGARMVIDALSNTFGWLKPSKMPRILFAGNNIGEDYLSEMIDYLKGVKFGVINISKSGTTTETAITFRLLKKMCEDQRGKEEAKKVIVAITDAKKGAARTTADKEGYKSFIIPDNVGGRFSVLTPVGLLPIAVAGFDIAALVKGAQDMEKQCDLNAPCEENPAAIYAAIRNAIYQSGKKIEIMANYQPKLHNLGEWWKHHMEAIAAHVHPIPLSPKVIHQFLCSIYQTRLDGTERKEFVAGAEAIGFGRIQPLAKTEGMTETFDDKITAFDFSLRILFPQTDVGVPIVVVEDVGV